MTVDEISAFIAAVDAVSDAYKDKSYIRDLKKMLAIHEDTIQLQARAETAMNAANVETRKAQNAMRDGENTRVEAKRLMVDAKARSSSVSQDKAKLGTKETEYLERVEELESTYKEERKKCSTLRATLEKKSAELDEREKAVVAGEKKNNERIGVLRAAIS